MDEGIRADEFPIVSGTGRDAVHIDVEANVLARAIDQVVFAAATDEVRMMLTGVLAVFGGSGSTLAASDGFRLAVSRARLPVEVSPPVTALVPARALTELSRIIGGRQEQVQVVVGENRAWFRLEGVELVAQLLQLQYPDYERIIPERGTDHNLSQLWSVPLEAFEVASAMMEAMAQDFGWPKVSEGENRGCPYIDFQLPASKDGLVEDYTASASADPFGQDYDVDEDLGGKPWTPKVAFAFGWCIEWVEMSPALVADGERLWQALAEGLVRVYVEYVHSADFAESLS